MAPYILIGIAGIIGLISNGFTGLIVGLILGYVAAYALGETFNKIQGGAVPRKAREGLIARLLADEADVVQAAFPQLSGHDLYKAIEGAIDSVGSKAIKLSPNNSVVWTDRVVLSAVKLAISEQPTLELAALYEAIGRWIAIDWYGW